MHNRTTSDVPNRHLNGATEAEFVTAVIQVMQKGARLGARCTAPDPLRAYQPFADLFVAVWEALVAMQVGEARRLCTHPQTHAPGRGKLAWRLACVVKNHYLLRQDLLFNRVYRPHANCTPSRRGPACMGSHALRPLLHSLCQASLASPRATPPVDRMLEWYMEYRHLSTEELRALKQAALEALDPNTTKQQLVLPRVRDLIRYINAKAQGDEHDMLHTVHGEQARVTPRFQFVASTAVEGAQGAETSLECPVCLGPAPATKTGRHAAVQLCRCKHTMCVSCLTAWLDVCEESHRQPTCSICRAAI